ncbi:MAG: anthranilate phosphoribosyltransferase [Chlamydiae bacterium]|nr:anthranilate phosphoribosyltransferase [Chlamydiota bacterium]MBI3277075.1 anthranilate phosphoribosyltransferase [Chlamydiota bacterium]
MNLEFRKYIKAVGTGPKLSRNLTSEEAERAFQLILEGEATDAQIGALLVPLRMQGETVEELAAFTKVTRNFCHQIHTHFKHFVDCGVAYDGKIKFPHLMPVAAFVAAGAGAQVLLHGQSETPPKYGVSVLDVFKILGVSIDEPMIRVKEILEKIGVGFLSIEEISPRVAQLKRIREELGLRTVFNHIEKLWNPMNAPHQVISVYHGPYLQTIPNVLEKLNAKHALVVQGMEGTPDCRLNRVTKIVELRGNEFIPMMIQPKELGFEAIEEPVFEGLTPQENADFVVKCLESKEGALRDLSILNGALLIYASEITNNLAEAVNRARDSLDSRQALNKLQTLRKMNTSQNMKV